jgi:hypothetical protein
MRPFNQQVVSLKAHAGSTLPLFALMAITLIIALGAATYIGLNLVVQHELQKVVSTAAMVGGSSFFDDIDGNGAPVKSPTKAGQAAQAVFTNALTASGMLTNMGATLTSGPTVGGNTVSLSAMATIPTPFLAPVGINQLRLNATGVGQSVALQLPPISIDTTSSDLTRSIPLSDPLVDAPGVDLHVVSGLPLHGYRIEACSGGKCYDITRAAKLDGPGFTVDAPLGVGGPMGRVIYGSAYIDLAATGPQYAAFVKKASSLRLIDDGIYDQYDIGSGQRSIELLPQPTTFNQIEVYHFGSLCTNTGACTPPTPFTVRG